MVRDAYANYVVQTTLDVIPESGEKQKLFQELNKHADELVRLLRLLGYNTQPTNFLHSPSFAPYRKTIHLQSTLLQS
jgi:hypothetical protein